MEDGQDLFSYFGRLQAQGLIIPSDQSNFDGSIVWRDKVHLRDQTGAHDRISVEATDLGASNLVQMELTANPVSATDAARLTLHSDESGVTPSYVGVVVGNPAGPPPGGAVRVLDDTGQSDLLLRDSAAATGVASPGAATLGKSQVGLATIGPIPAAASTGSFTINHNLNVGGVQGTFNARAGGTVNPFLHCRISATAPNQVTVDWLAIAATGAAQVLAINSTFKVSYFIWTP